jgi:hypothetical protein
MALYGHAPLITISTPVFHDTQEARSPLAGKKCCVAQHPYR